MKASLLFLFGGLYTYLNMSNTFCDCPENNQIFLQDPATPVMEGIIYFHNLLMFFMVFVGIFVFYMLTYVIVNFGEHKVQKAVIFSHNSPLEIIWTILPAIILLCIAIPSFTLLYSLDELIDPQLTIKIVGHQWYWSYEISDFAQLTGTNGIEFDSYMTPEESLLDTAWVGCRLLVSRPELIVPSETHIRLLVTSSDVIHCWAVPSFGVKIDATPGRLSQTSLFVNRVVTDKPAVFFGQCSEICGVNHGFMPITVFAVNPEVYKTYLLQNGK